MLMRLGLAVLLLASALSGCASSQDDQRREIAAAFYPLAYVAERVAGDAYDITNLTSPGGEPHDLELSIRQTADLAGADVVLMLSGFQPAVDAAVSAHARGRVIDAASAVSLEHAHSDHDHGDDTHSDHDHGDEDPHFWLDPMRMADLGDEVAAALSAVEPSRASYFSSRALTLRDELTALDREFHTGLARCEISTVVVTHEAFGYLEKYGLHFEAILDLSPDAEPTAAVLADLRSLIEREGITTVFSERLASAQTAAALAREAGVDTAVLDPIEGLAPGQSADYLDLMRADLTALKEANRCA
ncbi:MAG: metal ABC transporter substrate-binding protein [Nocardioides sp.]